MTMLSIFLAPAFAKKTFSYLRILIHDMLFDILELCVKFFVCVKLISQIHWSSAYVLHGKRCNSKQGTPPSLRLELYRGMLVLNKKQQIQQVNTYETMRA